MKNYDLKLDSGWKFHLGELPRIDPDKRLEMSHWTSQGDGMLKEYVIFKYPENWHDINVPHDWFTSLPLDETADPAGGFKERGTAWYYNAIELPDEEIENARLVFDGVLGRTTVFVNGVIAKRNFCGYNRFSCEIGDYLIRGKENEILLHVDASRWEGWWYEGAGLYRPVRIEFRGDTYIDKEKTYISPRKDGDEWKLLINAKTNCKDRVKVRAKLFDAEENCVYCGEFLPNEDYVARIENPILWSPENPYLYKLSLALCKDGEEKDTAEFKVGFRTVEWIADKGMLLNEKPYRVRGICCHQDHAGVGAAVSREIFKYRLSILKKLGINAYRCAHHPADETLLSLCDEMGILVMPENRHFDVSEDTLSQVDSMIYVSRNHPSVFMYCLFNEEDTLEYEERGMRIAEKLKARIRALDDTRAITGAQNGGHVEKINASDALDVIGANYCIAGYPDAHRRSPEKVILGTENCPTYATRGVYKSDKEKKIFACYGDEWGSFSESLDETMENVENKPYVAGCFAWCGFDYRGEPTPYNWPSVMSHWGFCDECGFEKDTAYHLAAYYKDELMVHLLPHWNRKEGETVRVCAFTNGDVAELFINGKSYGEKRVEKRRAEWNVPFEKGVARVVAHRGKEEVSDEVSTAGKPARIELCDVSDDPSVRIVNLKATDENGVLIPDFCEKVFFDAPKGSILGVGCGNPNSHHSEKGSEINFFNGRAQIILRGGEGKLVARCDGLAFAEMKL